MRPVRGLLPAAWEALGLLGFPALSPLSHRVQPLGAVSWLYSLMIAGRLLNL